MTTVSDDLLERLAGWGVRRIFGYSGDGINGINGINAINGIMGAHDHARIERMLFDRVVDPVDGMLRPDRSRPGNVLELRRADAIPVTT